VLREGHLRGLYSWYVDLHSEFVKSASADGSNGTEMVMPENKTMRAPLTLTSSLLDDYRMAW